MLIGGLGDLEPIRAREGCEDSLEASFGRAEEGHPRWEATRVASVRAEETEPGTARATVTVAHRFADRDQPSLEDDIVYLIRRDGDWRIAQPSGTLYRAVGYPEPPLEALAPPGG